MRIGRGRQISNRTIFNDINGYQNQCVPVVGYPGFSERWLKMKNCTKH